MCAIIELNAGVTIPMAALENVVYNNPHGYGLVVMKDKNDLEVIRGLDKGGTDPDDIQELLEKYKDYRRFLHVRWKTEGDLSEDNLHPFIIYDDGKTQVYFFHNGTLQDFKPQNQDKRSDSKIFAEEFLVPLLKQFKGDYSNDLARKIITKFWGGYSVNKGLIISNKFSPMYINYSDWKEIKVKNKDDTEVVFKASNDTYFDKLSRGYEFDRREEERKASQSSLSFSGTGTKDWPVAKLKDIDLRPNNFVNDLKDIFCDSDLYSELGCAALSNLTEAEIMNFCIKDPEIAPALLVHITGMYSELLKEKLDIEEKHDRASKRIATLVATINHNNNIG